MRDALHCDGIFAPRAWRPRLMRCEVIAGTTWSRLSDHNPVAGGLAVGRNQPPSTVADPAPRRGAWFLCPSEKAVRS